MNGQEEDVLVVGLAAAIVASLLFNLGIAMQGLEARATPRELGLRLSLIGLLLHRRRWLIGLALGFVGIGPQVLAFAEAPFEVVQPALASGLLLLLFIGVRHFRERVTWAEVLGVAAIIGGIALVSWGAPTHNETHRGAAHLVAVSVGLWIVALSPFVLRNARFDSPLLMIVAAGCGFAGSNVATKLMSDDLGGGHAVYAAVWAAGALAFGVAATVSEMTAFQRRPATMVVPIVTSVQTFLPIILEPLFLNESWGAADYDGAPIAVGVFFALAGTVLVSRTRVVSRLAAGT